MADFEISPTGEIIKDYLKENGIKQKTLASLCGYSEKQISIVLNGKQPISKSLAEAMAKVIPDAPVSYWLKYDAKYQEQLQNDEEALSKVDYKQWSEKYSFKKLFKGKGFSRLDQIKLIKDSLGITEPDQGTVNMRFVTQASFLRDGSKAKEDNEQLLDAWIALCVYFRSLKTETVLDFKGKDFLKDCLAKNKALFCVTTSEDTIRNLRYFSKMVGINLILTDGAPTTYVRGACLRDDGKIYIIITSRFKNVEHVIFAFIHELIHIINGDLDEEKKAVLLTEDWVHEEKISSEAKNYFIKPEDYQKLSDAMAIRDDNDLLQTTATDNLTTPGMLVSFLQHDEIIPYAKHRYDINSFSLNEKTADF